MFQTKVVQKIKTHILCSVTFPRKSCRLWENVENTVQRSRPQVTIWRMRIACQIPKATNTHSQYAILIAFPLQQWLHERASVLRYTYSTVPVLLKSKMLHNFMHLHASSRIWDCISKPNLFIRYFKAIPAVQCNLNSSFTNTTFSHLTYTRIQFFVYCYMFRWNSAISRQSIHQYFKFQKMQSIRIAIHVIS